MKAVDSKFKEFAQKKAKEHGLHPLSDDEINWLWMNFLKFLDKLKGEAKQK